MPKKHLLIVLLMSLFLIFPKSIADSNFSKEEVTPTDESIIEEGKYPPSSENLDIDFSELNDLACTPFPFSQNDPAFQPNLYTASCLPPYNWTMASGGCTITSLAMMLKYYGVPTNPRILDDVLGSSRCPLSRHWQEVATVGGAGSDVQYIGAVDGTRWDLLQADLSVGRPVVIRMYRSSDGINHYMLVISGSGTSYSNYIAIDPWDGGTKNLSSYSNRGYAFVGLIRYTGTPYCLQDQVPPVTTAALEGTVGDAGWYRSGVTVILTASDDRSGVAYTEYNLNGSGWTRYTNPVNVSANGVHNLQYRSVDNRGNVEAIKTVGFQIDTQPPLNPTNVDSGCGAVSGNWQNICSEPSFSWSGAGDATSGVQGYEYYWGMDPMGTVGTYTEQTSYNPPVPGQGERYLRIRTKDIAGNYSNWQTLFRYRYDSEPPTGNLLINNGASLSYTTLVRAGLSANDQMSGVWEYRLRNKNSAWSEWNRFVRECQWVIEEETGANHQVEVQYRDKAGNESATYGSTIYLNLYPSQSSSNKYMLERSTIGTAGVWTSSAKYQLLGTMGQPSMIGEQESSNTISEWGYWTRRTPWVHEVLELFLPMIIN